MLSLGFNDHKMPPRLSKRQQRQLEEEQLAAQIAAKPGRDDDEEEEAVESAATTTTSAATTSLFNHLGADDVAEAHSDSDEPDAAAKKQSANVGATAAAAAAKKKTKNKKKKKNSAAPNGTADEQVDEIDAALAALDAKLPPAERAAAQEHRSKERVALDARWRTLCDALSFQTKNLDPDAELHKMFGRQVIGSNSTAQQSPSLYHPRIANNPHNKAVLTRKSALVKANPNWPPLGNALETEQYEGPEREADSQATWIKFVHTKKYRTAQLLFLEILQQADGNRLFEALRLTPYHIDSLLQLSEMSAHQGDQGAASDFLDRAIYALSSLLPSTLPNGSVRLAYAPVENRAIHLAIARKVAILVKRGTWRTALEWAKAGLSLGGQHDPVGMLLWIDFLAAKCEDSEWLVTVIDLLREAFPKMHVDAYPGLAFAKALCLKQLEEASKPLKRAQSADDTLKEAVLRFPAVVVMLSTAAGTSIPPELSKDERAQLDPGLTSSYPLGLLCELYVARSSPLWKEPMRAAWLSKVAREAAPSLSSTINPDVKLGREFHSKGPFAPDTVPEGVERAAFLADMPSLRPFIRSSLLMSTSYSFNPIPPSSPHATSYDDAYFEPVIPGRRARSTRSGPSIGAFDFGGDDDGEGEDEEELYAVQQAVMDMVRQQQEQGAGTGGPEPDAGLLRRWTRMLFGAGADHGDGVDEEEQD